MNHPLDDADPTPHPAWDALLLGRRRFLNVAGGTVIGGIALSLLNACSSSSSSAGSTTSGSVPSSGGTPTSTPGIDVSTTSTTGQTANVIDGTLPIPPLLAADVQGSTSVFRLTLEQGQREFIAGKTTTTFGFNGAYLGPTLRAAVGDDVRVEVTNDLGEVSTVHWHGMHLPAAMDGGPHQTIADSTTWSPEFTITQPAATLWYHPHLMGQTLRQVGMGMAGLFILDDDNPAQQELPHDYGVDDIPLILQATTFDSDGQINVDGGGGRGGGGNTTTLVNGAIAPTISTPSSRLRFRILNASREDFYVLGFDGDATFTQVASDGGLLASPVQLTRLQLAPAERAEIVVEVDPSAPMVLKALGGNGGRGTDFQTGTLLTISSSQQAAPAPALPASLATIDRLDPSSAAQTRDFVLAGGGQNPTINGQSMTSMADMMDLTNVIRVQLDTTEIWRVINRSDDSHAFHVHDIQFQIIDRNGKAPAANESGWKDTVSVSPNETVRLIMHFADFADPTTPYMYHCHLLNHEDDGMMGQFLVV